MGGVYTVIGVNRIEVSLLEYDPSAAADVTLDASTVTGIVSAFDGTEWAGASNVGLPFPP